MHKLLSILITFNAFALAISAQTARTVTIKGVYQDSLTNEGEPYATLRLVKADAPTSVVKMAVTDQKGVFTMSLPAVNGKYTLTISSLGKENAVRQIVIDDKASVVDLKNIYARNDSHTLKGVEVTAQKPLVKAEVDRLSYDIAADPDSKTNTVIEMLRKVPLVTVDGEDNIKVNGNSSFKIYVNGKPSTMMSNNPKEVLKSMPASTIKKIDVITSPGAKYDAEGVAGILNIVTAENTGIEGYTATLRAAAGNNEALGSSIYATVKKKKLTFSVNYSYNHRKQPAYTSEGVRENLTSDAQRFLDTYSTSSNKINFHYGTFEASYDIDTLQLVSAALNVMGYSANSDILSQNQMWNLGRTTRAYSYSSNSTGDMSQMYVEGNIDYQRMSRKNKERVFTLSYHLNNEPQTNDQYLYYKDIDDAAGLGIVKNYMLYNSHTKGKSKTMEHTFQADYTTPFAKYHKLDFGLKFILRNNTSDDKVYEASAATDEYDYKENRSSKYKHINDILAAYASYTLNYKNLSFMPGVRYEYTYQQVKYLSGAIPADANFNTHYSNLVPSVILGYKLGMTTSLRLEYNMRISRPNITNLNPYFDNRTPMSINQGNSYLKSEKAHSIRLNYGMFSMKFNLNAQFYHSFSNDGIENVSRLIGEKGEYFDDGVHFAPAGALYTTYQNIGKSRDTGLSTYASWNPFKPLRLYANIRGGYRYVSSEAMGLTNYGWSMMAFGGLQYEFPHKLRFGINAGGSTPDYQLQGKGSGWSFYSCNVSKSFLKDRLTVSANVSNLFTKYLKYNGTTSSSTFVYKTSVSYPSRYFAFTVSYRIGDLKATVKKAEHSITNDDVKQSGSQGSQGGGAPQGGGGQ
jgi:outer membrane receptor protein involved in Fe transport